MLSFVYTTPPKANSTPPLVNSRHSSSSPSPFHTSPSNTQHSLSLCSSPPPRSTRFKMSSSDSLPPLPENRTVLGVGGMGLDFLAVVSSYPKPDDKIRTTSLKVQGGGNASNALTCVARLGLSPRVISKVAGDTQGRGILDELQADGVDTSFVVVSIQNENHYKS